MRTNRNPILEDCHSGCTYHCGISCYYESSVRTLLWQASPLWTRGISQKGHHPFLHALASHRNSKTNRWDVTLPTTGSWHYEYRKRSDPNHGHPPGFGGELVCQRCIDPRRLVFGRSTRPSIADLLAYEDVAQLTLLGLLLESILQSDYPQIHAWLKRMEKVPFHDEIYQAMTTLDDVTIETDVPFPKRLGAANERGIQVLMGVQSSFEEEKLQSKL